MFTFAVRSDVVILGRHWEDNAPIFGEAFFVIAEAANGTRYRHFHSFISHERVRDTHPEAESEFWFRPRHEKAKAAAKRFLARVQARKIIDMEHWVEIEAMYGSDAYVEQGGDAEMIAWERRLEEESLYDLANVA